MLDLVAAGLVVDGLDSSSDMLRRCRRAAAARGLEVTLHQQTMEAMDLGTTYPGPIVDHRAGRERALKAYAKLRTA